MLNGADYLILVIIGISAAIGLWRGFVKEVFALVNWIAALALAYLFYEPVSTVLPFGDTGSLPGAKNIVAGGLIFICTLVCGGLLSALLQGFVRATGLSGTDRTLGLVFGLARAAAVILALLIMLPSIAPVAEQTWWQSSQLIPAFLNFEDWAKSLLESITIWFNTIFSGGEQ